MIAVAVIMHRKYALVVFVKIFELIVSSVKNKHKSQFEQHGPEAFSLQ
jgi:hypothetical protein